MNIKLDEGFMFGLGIFETIAVEDKKAVFLEEHLKRMEKSSEYFELGNLKDRGITKEKIEQELQNHPYSHGVLKIMLSKENVIFQKRANTYCAKDYEKGFFMDFSDVKRNETSPLTYHKTMNYGDCILEKRNASKKNLNEKIFLNTKGQISEGTISNIFFVKKGTVYTPKINCGLLPGIMREYICRISDAVEIEIYPDEIESFGECFVTNSLMGIMPVKKLSNVTFSDHQITKMLMKKYQESNKFFDSFV